MSSSALLSLVLRQELAGELRVSGRLMDESPRGSIPMATESAKVPKIPRGLGSAPPGCSEVRGPSPLLALETYMRLCDCRSLVRFFFARSEIFLLFENGFLDRFSRAALLHEIRKRCSKVWSLVRSICFFETYSGTVFS